MINISRIILLFFTIILPFGTLRSQESLNRIDEKGLRQGHWIKKYQNGQIMYEAYFKDDRPAGEFKRYDEEGKLTSVLDYTGDTVYARFYHPNGFLAGEGKYLDQKKTGEWLYYSDYVEDHLLMRCQYINDRLVGMNIKYHWNGEIAEKLEYKNGIKSGRWIQYFTDGTPSLEGSYTEGKLNGEFRSWHPDGTREITGMYSMDVRTGRWIFYNRDGTIRKEIKYNMGIPENRAELIREETEYLDRLEREGGKLNDPEITGIIK